MDACMNGVDEIMMSKAVVRGKQNNTGSGG